VFLSIASLICVAAAPATKPATKPALPPLGGQVSLLSDLIQYNEPPNPPWATPEHHPDGPSAVYTTSDRFGQLAILVEPKDMVASDNVAVAIMKELRSRREKAGVKVIMQPTIEHDSRFAIRIHEKYKVGDHTNDSLQLFRNVGPRLVLVIVGSLSDDPHQVALTHATGEAVLLSAKFNRAAFKPEK